MPSFYHDVVSIVAAVVFPTSDTAMIHRRHALGLLAAASLLPSRSFADVAPQRSEIRESLAKHFLDVGTVGTFVGYKVDDYLVIASDKNRSGEAKLPASTFKIPNSIIALETGVVSDPDKDVFKWDGVVRSIEAWNKDHTLRSAIAASAVPVYQEIARRIGAGANAEICRSVRLRQPRHRRRHRPVLADRQSCASIRSSRSISSTGCGAASCRCRNAARIWCAISCRSPRSAMPSSAPRAGLLGAEIGKPSLGWMVGWAEKGEARTVFALNMDCLEPRHIADRMTITQQCLADIGAL